MSVSDPWEKIEWGADSEPQINERVPSSEDMISADYYRIPNTNTSPIIIISIRTDRQGSFHGGLSTHAIAWL